MAARTSGELNVAASRRWGLRAPDEGAGQFAGMGAVLEGHRPPLQRPAVAPGALQEAVTITPVVDLSKLEFVQVLQWSPQ